MRARERDVGGTTTFGGRVVMPGPSSGSVPGGNWLAPASGGTGTIVINFDVRLVPLTITANPESTGRVVRVDIIGPGTFRLVVSNIADALVNDAVRFVCAALDKR
jgi:hypothetical protein